MNGKFPDILEELGKRREERMPTNPRIENDHEIDVLAWLEVVQERWRVVLVASLAGVILGFLNVMISAPIYEARASILLATPDVTQGGGVPAVLRGGPSPLEVLKGILLSERARTRIATRTRLQKRAVKSQLQLLIDEKSNQLIILTQGPSKQSSENLGAAALEALETLNRDVTVSKASRQAEFLKGTITRQQRLVDKYSQALSDFQKGMRAPSDPEKLGSVADYAKALQELQGKLGAVEKQIEATKLMSQKGLSTDASIPSNNPALNMLKEKLVEQELKLRIAETRFNGANPEVLRLKKEIEATREQTQIELGKQVSALNNGLDPKIGELFGQKMVLQWQIERAQTAALEAPMEAVAQQKILRNLQTASLTLGTLREQYERARVESEVQRVQFSVLDSPLADFPVNKNPLKWMLIGALTMMMLASITILFKSRQSKNSELNNPKIQR